MTSDRRKREDHRVVVRTLVRDLPVFWDRDEQHPAIRKSPVN